MGKLTELWQAKPDLRLGQIMAIIFAGEGDGFYMEDDKVEERIARYLEHERPS